MPPIAGASSSGRRSTVQAGRRVAGLAAFAWDEGEGDRTRADWVVMHVRYFTARATAEGFVFDELMPAVLERFTLVWPPEHADPCGASSGG
jgi:hypothetical protein